MNRMAKTPIRAVVEDDHEVVHDGAKSFTNLDADPTVVAEVGAVRAAIHEKTSLMQQSWMFAWPSPWPRRSPVWSRSVRRADISTQILRIDASRRRPPDALWAPLCTGRHAASVLPGGTSRHHAG